MPETVPKDILYDTPDEYKEHYKNIYCRQKIFTFDGIRVFFREQRFYHAFYEGEQKGKNFSWERAKKIDWIGYTLGKEDADLRFGYYPKKQKSELNRRISVIFEKYLVVLELHFKHDALTAEFITAFPIKGHGGYTRSARWEKEKCLSFLKENGH